MARVQINIKQYRAMTAQAQGDRRPALLRNLIPLWGIALAAMVLAALARQYFFLLVVGSFAAFMALGTRLSKSQHARYLRTNPFALGPFEVELRPDGYTLRAGETRLELSTQELDTAIERGSYFALVHRSGVKVALPKWALSEHEIATLRGYVARHPEPKRLIDGLHDS